MSVLTVRLPDAKPARIKELALSSGVSTNKLIEELVTVALAQQDAQVRLELRAAQGDAARGLALLDKLDADYAASAAHDLAMARVAQATDVDRSGTW
jgi:hypothetical protein